MQTRHPLTAGDRGDEPSALLLDMSSLAGWVVLSSYAGRTTP